MEKFKLKEKTKVLIVDDEELFCECMTDILEVKGYDTDSVNSGHDAITKVKDKFFDVILMDIKMPEMNGVEAFNQIKEISPKTVVIMMTAYSLENLISDALRNGAFSCLNKPVDIDEVVGQIELATRGILMLIMDDDVGTREKFKNGLEAEGYKVSAASTAEEAIEIAKGNTHNILFLDINIATVNSLDVYLSIKEIDPHIVIVMIIDNEKDMKEWTNKSFIENSNAFLTKPLDMNKCIKLIKKISRYINNRGNL
jgi:two-component system response regulator HydG